MDTYISTGSNDQNNQYGNISASTLNDIWAQFIVLYMCSFSMRICLKKVFFPIKTYFKLPTLLAGEAGLYLILNHFSWTTKIISINMLKKFFIW